MTVGIFKSTVCLLFVAVLAVTTGLSGSETKSDSPQPKAVVELFTSQACSSCPPAIKLFEKYVKRDNVIALSFPVDYWDYLGWKDTLARPAYSFRQRSYASARGDGEVYTPQVVVGGLQHANGSDETAIERAIAKTQQAPRKQRVELSMWAEGGVLVINVGAARDRASVKPATIWLALVKKTATVSITRGENSGSEITYHAVVRQMTPVGRWTGDEVVVKLPKYHLASDGCTVLLQEDTAGPILAAVEMKDW